ncbi:hypothetical protein KFZ58_04665 [Virgibacillus sp. NKC19-16]|uniref:hypothetical protein n=1 Tax=Virgibacillus salidurans TaxID=2831673 RepID=UPI001F2D167D|nr:hypothetical protein [Virgibacillus sp. NKC19-16]UJL47209.1 hypothetical protein KFZ58_04665 [Virgibacillus sp. NKC19-16]
MEKKINKKSRRLEVLLWSIALPGFGQLLNHKYLKGFLLVVLEVLVNVMGNFNRVIVLSFNGQIPEAIEATNYLWLMFYPCLYFFAIWDAYKDAGGGGEKPFAYLPLVFSAYFVTIGLIFSAKFTVFGTLIGPMWLPILFLPIGLCVGAIIRWILLKVYEKDASFD